MLHTSFATPIQQCIAKPGLCVASCDMIPDRLCLEHIHTHRGHTQRGYTNKHRVQQVAITNYNEAGSYVQHKAVGHACHMPACLLSTANTACMCQQRLIQCHTPLCTVRSTVQCRRGELYNLACSLHPPTWTHPQASTYIHSTSLPRSNTLTHSRTKILTQTFLPSLTAAQKFSLKLSFPHSQPHKSSHSNSPSLTHSRTKVLTQTLLPSLTHTQSKKPTSLTCMQTRPLSPSQARKPS